MPKEWNELTDDEILNFEEAHTGKMARYERIMQQRNIESLKSLRDKLTGLMETIYRASQGMKGKTDEIITLYGKYTKSQNRQQLIIIILTVVIAASTAVYTWITWQSVSAMKEANNIQMQLLELEKEKLKLNKTHNKSLNQIGAKDAPPG